MHVIFYDLETTDLASVGQILNYAFIEVDEQWEEVSRCVGDIRIARTQLPQPRAILANRTDVLEHQRRCSDSEPVALRKIHSYIEQTIDKRQDVLLFSGFNSGKFDLNFLRTSMIRNGIKPYFGQSLVNADVKYVCSKAALIDPEFRKKLINSEGRVSFKLEGILKALDILKDGENQKHDSVDDVRQTIQLAKVLQEKYNLDLRVYDAYEMRPYEKKGAIINTVYPDVEPPTQSKWTLLDRDKNYVLWINLADYKAGKGRDSIKWLNKSACGFYNNLHGITQEDKDLVAASTKELADINLSNYFPEKTCDIEQHIYSLPFPELEALTVAIWNKDRSMLKDREAKLASKLYIRHLINNANDMMDLRLQQVLREYALYRYGGRLKLSKFNPDSRYVPGVYNEDFHTTWNELLQEIDALIAEKTTANLQEDVKLLTSLKTFYLESDIAKVCKAELEQIHRVKLNEPTK